MPRPVAHDSSRNPDGSDDVLRMLDVFQAEQLKVVAEHEVQMKQLMKQQCERFRRIVQEARAPRTAAIGRASPFEEDVLILETHVKQASTDEDLTDGTRSRAKQQLTASLPKHSASSSEAITPRSRWTRARPSLNVQRVSAQRQIRSFFVRPGESVGSESSRKMSSIFNRRHVAAAYMFHSSQHETVALEKWSNMLFKRRLRCESLKRFLESGAFQVFVCILIVMNAAFIAWRTQRATELAVDAAKSGRSAEEVSPLFDTGEVVFNVVFAVELMMRLLAYECAFFSGPERNWNVLDMCLVIPSAFESMLTTLDMNISFIRTLRLLRMLRTLRMIRIMRFAATFRHLRLMLLAVLNCIVPLFWAIFFLMFMIFLFAIMFMQGTELYMTSDGFDDAYLHDMTDYLFPLPMMILTLFMCISGGISWWEIAMLLEQLGLGYLVMFILFILIMFIVVLNIITGIFVNESIESARKDHDLISQIESIRQRQILMDLQKLFKEIDIDDDGSITLEEFDLAVRDPEGSVRSIFLLLDIDVTDARAFFHMIDVDNSNKIEIDEFVMGCMHFRGNGHYLGIEALMQDQKKLLKDIIRRQKKVESQVKDVSLGIHDVLSTREEAGVESLASCGPWKGKREDPYHEELSL